MKILKSVQFPIGSFGNYGVQRYLVAKFDPTPLLIPFFVYRGYVCGVTCLTLYRVIQFDPQHIKSPFAAGQSESM